MMRWNRHICTAYLMAALLPAGWVCAEETEFDFIQLMSTQCLDCHAAQDPEAGLDLSQFRQADDVLIERRLWTRVLARVAAREMPPADFGKMTADEVAKSVQWIERQLQRPNAGVSPGPIVARRLNRFEYTNSVRDLMGIHVDVGQGLPLEGAGGEGFDNASETLFLSPVHIEKFMQAAEVVTDYVARDASARALLFEADENPVEESRARQVLKRFLERAFRRPATDQELQRYVQHYQSSRTDGDGFEEAILATVRTVLVSPLFLFRVEKANLSGQAERVSDFELATRLSYFLWASIPDQELNDLAAEGKLSDPLVLREQVDRMLTVSQGSNRSDVPKSRALAENFAGQWLGTRDLGNRFKPDANVFEDYDYELEFALRYEPAYFLEYMLVENKSLLDLIDSDYTFMNKDLARHYELEDRVKIRGYGQMRHVELPPDSHRGGVLTMGATLAISSYPHRSSPVLRGKWILETLLDVTLPPPPPNVPSLDEEAPSKQKNALTLRQRLEQHREDAACAVCHDCLDPWGFALENYDAIGRWREKDGDRPVDAHVELPNGAAFSGVEGLKQVLMERKDEFARAFTTKMLGYALGRGLINEDFYSVERIVSRLKQNDYAIRELIYGVVESEPFLYKSSRVSEVVQNTKPAE